MKKNKEALFNSIVGTVIDTLKIDRAQAEKRVNALLKSGILNNGSPNDPAKQREIDMFIITPIED